MAEFEISFKICKRIVSFPVLYINTCEEFRKPGNQPCDTSGIPLCHLQAGPDKHTL